MNDPLPRLPSLASLLVRARGGLSVDALAYKAQLSGNSIRNAEAGHRIREATMKAILRAARPDAALRAEIIDAFDRERAVHNILKVMRRLGVEGAK